MSAAKINLALTQADNTDERWFEADLHRIAAGGIVIGMGDARGAEAHYNRALSQHEKLLKAAICRSDHLGAACPIHTASIFVRRSTV